MHKFHQNLLPTRHELEPDILDPSDTLSMD